MMRKAFTRLVPAAALALALTAPAFAARTEFNVKVSGANEMPPVAHTGTGVAQLTYDPATRLLGWSFKYKGFHSPVIMVHFHQFSAPGKSGPIMLWISQKGAAKLPDPITGYAILTPEQAKAFEAGQWYINVHTKAHPAGAAVGPVNPPM